jgi:hypothetical protein
MYSLYQYLQLRLQVLENTNMTTLSLYIALAASAAFTATPPQKAILQNYNAKCATFLEEGTKKIFTVNRSYLKDFKLEARKTEIRYYSVPEASSEQDCQ